MAKFQTNPDCIKQREYIGIPAWHAAEHTSKGQVIFAMTSATTTLIAWQTSFRRFFRMQSSTPAAWAIVRKAA